MTSIPVKDVGSVFVNASRVQGSGVSKTGDFQAVWDAQTGKGVQSDAGKQDVKTSADKSKPEITEAERSTETSAKPERTQEPKESTSVQEDTKVSGTKAVDDKTELTDEELEKALEVLGTAAYDLMQQIADMFGISMQELQTTMDALGMEQMDVLNTSELSNLLLQIGGAADSYALVTDESLYTNYRALMNQLNGLLNESAAELDINSEELNQLLAQISEETVETTDMPMIEVIDQVGEMAAANGETATADDEMTVADGEAAMQEMNSQTERTESVGFEDAGEGHGSGMQNSQEGKTEEESKAGETVNDRAMHRGNEFAAQNVRTDSFANQVQTAATAYTESPWDAQTYEIMRQITDSMKIQITADTQSMELQLHPASLGNVQVNVASRGGVITANFITENEAVKAALETQMIQLRDSFAEQGVKVDAIEVMVQPHAFERNLDQGRGNNNQQDAPKRNRTRRINLSDAVSMSDMDDGEKLAAEMMAANGNTVDYTV